MKERKRRKRKSGEPTRRGVTERKCVRELSQRCRPRRNPIKRFCFDEKGWEEGGGDWGNFKNTCIFSDFRRIVGRIRADAISRNRVYETRVCTHAGTRHLEINALKLDDARREGEHHFSSEKENFSRIFRGYPKNIARVFFCAS